MCHNQIYLSAHILEKFVSWSGDIRIKKNVDLKKNLNKLGSYGIAPANWYFENICIHTYAW